jgi:hypothetical protein
MAFAAPLCYFTLSLPLSLHPFPALASLFVPPISGIRRSALAVLFHLRCSGTRHFAHCCTGCSAFTVWTSSCRLPSPSATTAFAAPLLVSHPFRHWLRFLFCPISATFNLLCCQFHTPSGIGFASCSARYPLPLTLPSLPLGFATLLLSFCRFLASDTVDLRWLCRSLLPTATLSSLPTALSHRLLLWHWLWFGFGLEFGLDLALDLVWILFDLV